MPPSCSLGFKLGNFLLNFVFNVLSAKDLFSFNFLNAVNFFLYSCLALLLVAVCNAPTSLEIAEVSADSTSLSAIT